MSLSAVGVLELSGLRGEADEGSRFRVLSSRCWIKGNETNLGLVRTARERLACLRTLAATQATETSEALNSGTRKPEHKPFFDDVNVVRDIRTTRLS